MNFTCYFIRKKSIEIVNFFLCKVFCGKRFRACYNLLDWFWELRSQANIFKLYHFQINPKSYFGNCTLIDLLQFKMRTFLVRF